jgi:hypothetical protein
MLVWALMAAIPVAAQGTGGVITGTIKDAQSGVLPGVSLTVRNVDSGISRTVVTEGDGTFRLAGLPPGRYDLTGELSGFANAEVKGLTITIGLELRRDITMALQGVQETLTVTGEAPIVETTRTEVSAVVTQEQIDSLPLANRQPISLALLLPGTSMDSTSVRRAQPAVGAGGSSNTMNVYYVDGGLNLQYNSGQQFLEVPQSAVREFKVNISESSAQFGAVGGVVLTATKSGTNRFSGEAFEFFRDKSLNALDKFEKQRHDEFGDPKPDYRRHSYGFALGGPAIKDRLHFFFALERSSEEKTATVETGQPQFYSKVEGNFPAPYLRRMYFARGDFQLNSQQHVFARFAYDKELTECENCGGATAGFSGTDTHSPRMSTLLGHTWVISSRMLNEIRSQVPPSSLINLGGPPGLPKWPADGQGQFPPERFTGYTQVYNFPSLTWGANQWSNNRTDRWDIADDFTVNLGRHDLKVGGAVINFDSPEEQANNSGTWSFDTDQFFDGSPAAIANLKNPTQFTASFPPLPRYLKSRWLQTYVQDQWRLRSNLTVDLGLRYDNQYKSFNNHLDITPVPRLAELIDPKSRHDNNNFGPRAGFAWDVRNDGRSVVRGGAGVTYQYVMAGGLRPEMTALRQTNITIRNPPYPDPYGGRTPASFASTAPPNVSVTDDKIENPRADTVTLGYSQELKANLAIHLDGAYTNVDHVTQTANVNTPITPTGAKPRPTWGRMITLQSKGEHQYRALLVRLDKRYARRHQYLLSYTLAKQDNTGAGTNPLVTDFYNPGLDFGPGSADRRHTLVASGSVLLPLDIMVGAVWTLRSTMPFSARAGLDLNNDGTTTQLLQGDYVPGTTRNIGNRDNEQMLAAVNAWRALNGRAPIAASQIDTNDYNRVDIRASKAFILGGSRKVEFIAQVFNLLGRDNLGGIAQGWQDNALSDSFGRITTVDARQQAELAVRFGW